MRRMSWLVWGVTVVSACDTNAEHRTRASSERVIDSVLSMDTLLARFRRDLPKPAGLSGGAANRDTLVLLMVRALQTNDTAAFEQLAVTRAEWAWLYYPTNMEARPPYELPPGLAWLRLQEGNRKAVFRALRELGGRSLEYRGYHCPGEPLLEGENRVWVRCTVTVAREGDQPRPLRLFASMVERQGRFAFLSYANDF